ncbi:DUF6089 family protein [Fulvivirgaceae bacterium BMA12]|uniref:DUF6089 family protein n=1 Tax=Agaribacillus aureus TaxID=3051825 RepID=A0ABT8L2N8_9BACT|nr:DUF6089 family protein [Fulvivirgaceae bacterium BMA12]
MMKRIHLILASIIIFLSYNDTLGQANSDVFKQAKKNNRIFRFNKELRYTTVGISINAINYFGDLAPRPGNLSTDISFTRSGFGLLANHRVGSRVFLRGSLNWATMKGDDFESADLNDPESRDRYVRNLQFRNTIFELSGTVIFDLIRNHGFYVKRARFTPYIFTGFALFHHNPEAKVPEFDYKGDPLAEAGDWVKLHPLGTEGQNNDASGVDPYHKVQFSVPAGFGVRLRLNKNFDLAFEMGYRILFFDYIDDVSNEYPDYGLLENDLARTLSGRAFEPIAVVSGDPRNSDILQILDQSRTSYVGADNNSYFLVSDNHPGGQRGDNNDNDLYVVTSLQLTYVLGSPIGKPKFR